jgi:predicted transcriptional regulator
MNLQSEKIKLIEWLQEIKDIAILEKVAKIRARSLENKSEVQELTEEAYVSEIKKAEEEIREGEFVSHEAVGKAIKKW